jgi:anti-sigma factor ChrR (cupin superfamily)
MTVTTFPHSPGRDQAELDEAVGLLSQALAETPAQVPGALRGRLLARVADSAERNRGMVTVRARHGQAYEIQPGVRVRWLYRCTDEHARRPGEPVAVAIVELEPGARLAEGLALAGRSSEWLIVRGSCTIDGLPLATFDFRGRLATAGEPLVTSEQGATIYLRNGGAEPTPAGTARERDAVWEDYAPGIRRRVLWQADGAVAYIAKAINGAAVPSHGHHRDEESLMLDGDLFLGDVLIREGDFQLAPAGLVHDTVQAGSDCMVYIRGDADLAIDLGRRQ